MKQRFLVTLSLLSVLICDSPSRAETPAETVIDDMRATNVQRLILTNQCRRCDLVGTDLSKVHLIGADLRGALLTGANLSWSNLEGADLTGAHLAGANFTGAFLTNASLANATLDHANFSQAQIYYANVAGASMENLNLADATVVGTPISIGGAAPENNELPILIPDDSWQLEPPMDPPSDLWYVPGSPLEEILDIPPQIIPQV
ncbi:pentapeptide repeat-containing protein [Leptolyngbya cf. ectocarpi LEGE 11479]|uniref:Pentapeptide repeat-containing protein n=1 Tax=Leptolyngbya cf. ectocarpi LEGE 11479 TaxID=1828722 RepID=A0A928ZXC1_LEPEC|nr:pentapeptide repeat-containing protein [Leptolyngbya ectocarpi]MBE9069164.1 pentapeptide repeat-containing protein [Leptolyngbya cf. ectocarpi LEGE 11479]